MTHTAFFIGVPLMFIHPSHDIFMNGWMIFMWLLSCYLVGDDLRNWLQKRKQSQKISQLLS